MATDTLSVGWDSWYTRNTILMGEPDDADELVQKFGRVGQDRKALVNATVVAKNANQKPYQQQRRHPLPRPPRGQTVTKYLGSKRLREFRWKVFENADEGKYSMLPPD